MNELDEAKLRKQLVLWKSPLTTILYAIRQVFYLCERFCQWLLRRKQLLLCAFASCLLMVVFNLLNGPHQQFLNAGKKLVAKSLYWLGLGVLSSIGFGTGLHTFILYLGPHIAAVTLAAYECKSVDFPEPPYPDEIICPASKSLVAITMFNILSKVRLEALLWGAGTALGELPPYFMARTARLSSLDAEDAAEIVQELEALERVHEHPEDAGFLARLKLYSKELIENLGFFGILACASIPNPFFDLAGMVCGHFLVPFPTFFLATLIGKALIKMHIQQFFVIFIFNESQIEGALSVLSRLPLIGKRIQGPVRDYLALEKLKLYKGSQMDVSGQKSILGWIMEFVVCAMIIGFVISIINSAAQSYHKRICKERRQLKIA